MGNNFFEKLIYSSCNEDSFSEIEALKINQDDQILCITASGARTLDLLTKNPKKIISIDFNPVQNYLLELKMSAYKNLNYEDFCKFLGIEFSDNIFRSEIYKNISFDISDEAKNYWDKNLSMIHNGIIFEGKWDKLLILFSKILFFRKGKLKKIFNAKNISEQSKLWNDIWDTFLWKFILRISTSKFLWKYVFKEPGVNYLKKDFSVYKYLHKRFSYLGNNHLLSQNYFANLFFLGKYDKRFLPIHLQEKNFDLIKENLHKIEIYTDSLQNIIQNNQIISKISAFSLSDFGSYSDEENYELIWKNLFKNGKKGAKICERQFLIKRNPEKIIGSNVKRNFSLEEEIGKQDLTVFYTFIIGIISKN